MDSCVFSDGRRKPWEAVGGASLGGGRRGGVERNRLRHGPDGIRPSDGGSVEGLSNQRGLGVVARQPCIPKSEVKDQIGIAVTVHVLLMAARLPAFLVNVRFTGPFKGHRGVIHRGGIKNFGGEKRSNRRSG